MRRYRRALRRSDKKICAHTSAMAADDHTSDSSADCSDGDDDRSL